MTDDPAVDAAQRVWDARRKPTSPLIDPPTPYLAVAQEAHRLVRELHHPVTNALGRTHCAHCVYEHGHDDGTVSVRQESWPCDTARLVYRKDELT